MKRENVLRKQGRRLHWRSLPSFGEVVEATIRKYSARLAATITTHNAIMRWIENVK